MLFLVRCWFIRLCVFCVMIGWIIVVMYLWCYVLSILWVWCVRGVNWKLRNLKMLRVLVLYWLQNCWLCVLQILWLMMFLLIRNCVYWKLLLLESRVLLRLKSMSFMVRFCGDQIFCMILCSSGSVMGCFCLSDCWFSVLSMDISEGRLWWLWCNRQLMIWLLIFMLCWVV